MISPELPYPDVCTSDFDRDAIAKDITNRYALSAATTFMLWLVVRRPAGNIARKIRQSKE